MDLQLKNQAILITGSSRGIGQTISEEFLKEKAKVFITGRNYKTLESTFLDFKNPETTPLINLDFGSFFFYNKTTIKIKKSKIFKTVIVFKG